MADYMSRHPLPWSNTPKKQRKEAEELEKTVWFLQYNPYTEAISIEKLIRESEKDSTIIKLKKALTKGKLDKKDQELSPYKNLDQLTITESGLVMKKEKIILPLR